MHPNNSQTIKDVLENYAFPLYFLLHVGRGYHLSQKNVVETILQWNIKHISMLNIDKYKKSDTLFILGSGASINKYGEKEWAIIREKDSIGFNFWLIHDFVPTYFAFEPFGCQENEEIFFDILHKKHCFYKDTPFIVKGMDFKSINLDKIPANIKNNVFAAPIIRIPGSNQRNMNRSIELLKQLKLLGIRKHINYVVTKRASISFLTIFGLFAGYKKIVLCGVDLNNPRYFFEEYQDYYTGKGLNIPDTEQRGQVHSTLVPGHGDVSIDKVIYSINKILLINNNINLYIGSRDSALYPSLPYYFG